MKARTSGAVQGIMFLLVLPLSFGSSTFVPVTRRCRAGCRPSSRSTRSRSWSASVRGLMVGGPVASAPVWTLAWMAGLLAVFVPLALRAYRRRV